MKKGRQSTEQLINDPVGGPGPVPVPLRVPVPGPARAPVPAFEFLPGVANIDINLGAHQIPNIDPFSMESNRETDKVESFADDKTVTFLATLEGLSAVREILQQFESLSGLSCNMDKSVIMFVGSDDPPPDFINQFEFVVVDKIKILGLEISSKADNLPDCHGNTINKITKIVTFWDRFFLSLPGRLNITKTMILSQISYLGCIITPTKTQ